MADSDPEARTTDSVADLLAAWKMVLGLSLEQISAAFEPAASDVITGGSYECMNDVTIVHAPPPSPGSVYLRDGRVVLMFVGDVERWPQISPDSILETLGEPDEVLRSRAGRGNSLLLYARAGFAVSIGDTVDFVEVFEPTTVAEYTEEVYSVPEFRR
jgi:hypothetical protein